MAQPKILSVTASGPRAILVHFSEPMTVDAALTSASSYAVSPSLEITPSVSIASVSTAGASSVRLNLAINMRSGEVYTLAASLALTNRSGETLDPAFAGDTFVGIGDAPQLLSSEALDGSTVRLTFSEPMDIATLGDRGSYRITSEADGRLVDVRAASPIELAPDSGWFSQVDLDVGRMTGGVTHRVLASGLLDAAGNPQLAPAQDTFTGIAAAPKMLSAAINPVTERLDITFDSEMSRAAVTAADSFLIVPQAGVPRAYYQSAQLDSSGRVVSLGISPTRAGSMYLVVASSLVADAYGNAIDPTADEAAFDGMGDSPGIKRVVTVGKNRIDVVFTKRMRDSAALRNPARYTLSGGASVLAVASVDGDTVKLVTTDQEPGILYTLTIA